MKKGDKVYEAWVSDTKGLVMYHEYIIKKVTKDDVWLDDKYEEQFIISLVDFEMRYGKTKQEAIDKSIKMHKMWIDDFKNKIKMLEAEKEKLECE